VKGLLINAAGNVLFHLLAVYKSLDLITAQRRSAACPKLVWK